MFWSAETPSGVDRQKQKGARVAQADTPAPQGETVYAVSTGMGRAALAVIRLTGPASDAVLQALMGDGQALPQPRMAAVRQLRHPHSGAVLDAAMVLRFVAPHSYTGENMVELHVHGGAADIASVMAALSDVAQHIDSALGAVRPAEAGAFTRRAVLNGKMDLTQAEAVADLIDAEGGAQQDQALRQMHGGLRQQMEGWREQLKSMLAHIEADIEFADEDLPGGVGQAALQQLDALRDGLAGQCDDRGGIVLRDGLRIALLGPPNAGKSSILNMLAGREAAIVSARAGTTRDVIEVAMQIGGVPVTLVDTAGLRAAGDDIEREGVRRAGQQAAEAHIRLLVISPDTVSADMLAAGDATLSDVLKNPDLTICNKADLGAIDGLQGVSVSATQKQGAEALVAALQGLVANLVGQNEVPRITRERHRAVLSETLTHLDRAAQAGALELAAEDLRLAQRSLGRLTGAVDVEQLLDIVFADFCIGK